MTPRMRIATCVTAIAIVAVSGCSNGDDQATGPEGNATRTAVPEDRSGSPNDENPDTADVQASPEPSGRKPTELPSVDSSSDGAIAIRGQWANRKARWTVSFHEDGSFTEDLRGISGYRTGRYEVEGDVVSLYGVDGTTVTGVVKGEKIVFKRATVVRL